VTFSYERGIEPEVWVTSWVKVDFKEMYLNDVDRFRAEFRAVSGSYERGIEP
jgi:hypothetical protein